MTKIQPINSYKQPVLSTRNTGYLALTSLCLTVINPKPLKKYHSKLGILTALLSVFHIGTSIYQKQKYLKNLNKKA